MAESERVGDTKAVRRVMAALELQPDVAETEKQQLAIGKVLEELEAEGVLRATQRRLRELNTGKERLSLEGRVAELEAISKRRERYIHELAQQVRVTRRAVHRDAAGRADQRRDRRARGLRADCGE